MKVLFAILLAAGRSERFGRDKVGLLIDGKPVWRHAFEAFLHHPEVGGVGLVVSDERIEEFKSAAPEATFVVGGGRSRPESAQRGLAAVPEEFDWVAFHDAARPFVSADLISRTFEAAETSGAACPGLAVTDTIKLVRPGSVQTLDRSSLSAVQTPQIGHRRDFLRGYALAGDRMTDDLSVLEAAGIVPQIVPGDPANIKITHPGDENRTPSTMEIRTGFGYDIHSFSPDPARPLWLGGVEFPEERPGLEGHSDADALLHAVVDALLGAVGLGDIGTHYPPSDPQWKDRASIEFLKETGRMIKEKGYRIVNIDSTVLAERPKILPRRPEIVQVIADALLISADQVSVKATTHEKLGALGRGEGIAAMAIATLSRP